MRTTSILCCLLIASFTAVLQTTAAEEISSLETQAIETLRKHSTNLQLHKDGTARLLRLSRPSVNDDLLTQIRHLRHLDYLAIVCPQITDANTQHLGGLSELDTLLLSQSGIGNNTLAHVRSLGKLERLYLAETAITDSGLPAVASLSHLRTLSLERTGITDVGLSYLQRLASLETLLLSETRITGDGLGFLAGLPNLRVVYLDHCPLVAEGLHHLAALPRLEHLSLSGVELDEAAWLSLSCFEHLKMIELYGTRISPAALARLRQSLPDTQLFLDPQRFDEESDEKETPRLPTSDSTSDRVARLDAEADTVVQPSVCEQLVDEDYEPDFQRHVIPLLGRLGCNGRACHGSFQGQGGFRLSMFGYDFALDHENLLERIDLSSPDDSLILNKPTSEDEHGGGKRFSPSGWEAQLLRRWIASGASGVAKTPAKFVRLQVTPHEIVFSRAGESIQLRAEAVWSDGTREDVTRLTRFQTNDDTVATVTPEGKVVAAGPGDTYLISFYDNGISSTQVLLPVSERTGDRFPAIPTPTEIDRLIVAKLAKLGIVPSELSSDAAFLRRVSLDLIGTLPTPAEIQQFVADESDDKRARKIDELLERPEYVIWWTQRLCDLTGSNAGYLGATEMAQPVAAQWRDWIRRRVELNVGWDRIAAGIITARSRPPGQPYREFIEQQSRFTRSGQPDDFAALGNPMPHFWYRDNITQPTDKALAFGYTFMGIRLDCAQCHKHPYDQWSKQDFELFTEFFTRIRKGVAPDAAALHSTMQNMLGVPIKLNTAALRRQSYLRIAAEGRAIPWNEVWIEPPGDQPQSAKLLAGPTVDLSRLQDPRTLLMEWLLSEPNHYFAKSFVNRIWANYFHVGLIDPPDDLNAANPASHKAVLEHLVAGFIDSDYDMKWLHRTIANCRTYQLSWQPNDSNRTDSRNFSHAILRRLPAEVAIDAMIQATANDLTLSQISDPGELAGRKIGQHPRSYQTRAIDYSLLIFGKPLRTTNCDCERQSRPTLLQSLYVRNDQEVIDMLDRRDGWLAQLAAEQPADERIDELIDAAYLRCVSRLPTKRERSDCHEYIVEADRVVDGLRDLLWALLNTQEFMANH